MSRAARAGKGRAAELIRRAGADEALTQLINQFTDPLAFLRELVQNSLDAAASCVEVTFGHQGGLMTIEVADNGEGMSEQIIDDYLLTLFRSTKENDLTKIGKFGVGFVSIFAMQPELVVLQTGQSGEAWRILFHPDARYEKLRLDGPVEGTTIALHRRVPAAEFGELRRRGVETVRYWCKYAEAEIVVDGAPVAEPFDIDAALTVRHREPGTEVVVGFAPLARTDAGAQLRPRPLVGFYNRGLTLVEGPAAPGEPAFLAGLSLRVKSRYLEHTLTRDNVLADESYDKAMAIVEAQVEQRLRPALVARLEQLARAHGAGEAARNADDGPSLARCLVHAALPGMDLSRTAPQAAIIPGVDGPPRSLRELRAGEPVLCAARSTPVTRLLAGRGVPVVRDVEQAVAPYLAACGIEVRRADVVYYTALRCDEADSDAGRALCRALLALLARGRARVKQVHLGQLSYPGSSVEARVHVRQQQAFGLTRAGDESQPHLLGGARQLVLNLSHPLVAAALELSGRDAGLGAHLVAQAVALQEGLDDERALRMARAALQGHAP